jgi:hypothetical protein
VEWRNLALASGSTIPQHQFAGILWRSAAAPKHTPVVRRARAGPYLRPVVGVEVPNAYSLIVDLQHIVESLIAETSEHRGIS